MSGADAGTPGEALPPGSSGGRRGRVGEKRREFVAARAGRIASAVLGSTAVAHDPGTRVSSTISLWTEPGGEALAVVVSPIEELAAVEAALAYGLTFQGDRDLGLVVPDTTFTVRGLGEVTAANPALRRAALIATPVRVWSYGQDDEVVEHVVPPVHDVLAACRLDPTIPVGEHQLGERRGWVAELITRADSDPALVEAHRDSYLSWHCAGRQVLSIRRATGGLLATCGVDYSAHRGDQPPPTVLCLSGLLEPDELDAAWRAVEQAVSRRQDRADDEDLEQRLQARLATPEGLAALGLTHVIREVPASRPTKRRAYIDLVGVDAGGHVHVIETKVGLDAMLALQGLDYWTWATAYRDDLRDLLRDRGLGVAKSPDLLLRFVVVTSADEQDPADLRYLAPQVEALAGRIPWRIGAVHGWRDPDDTLRVDWAPSRSVPEQAERFHPSRFALRLRNHLTAHATATGTLERRAFWGRLEEAIVPEAVPVAERLEQAGLRHRFFDHVCSSQAFAVNLFGALDDEGVVAVARTLDPTVDSADEPIFELTDPADRLAERTHASPHATQVDVALRTRTTDGARHLILIEVKLTEDDFNSCSAYQSPDNDTREVCARPGLFGGDPAQCFQLRNHGREDPRRYDQHLPGGLQQPDGAPAGCLVRGGLNQPMRNIALADALIDAGEADRATFALCAHDGHRAIWRRWAEARRLLPAGQVTLADLPASHVIRQLADDTATELLARYRLDDQATGSPSPTAEEDPTSTR